MKIVSREPDFFGKYTFFADWNGEIPGGFVEAAFGGSEFEKYGDDAELKIENNVAVGLKAKNTTKGG